jgi:thiamine biosynthesis lipoprotein
MRCDKQRWAAILITVLFCAAPSLHSSQEKPLVYRKKYVMGTVFEIAAYQDSSQDVSDSIDKAFREIVRIDDLLSDYKPESALSTLNRSAHLHTERVPPDLYLIIEKAVELSRVSEGKFDISIAPLVNLWKAALSGEATPTAAQEREVRDCVGYQKIVLTPPDQITFRSPCLQLDLGAIGKGYAVDRAGEILHASGVRDALINAGGSTIFAMGSPPGQSAWVVHLRDPSRLIDPYVMLKDESVSTSEQSVPSLLGQDSPGHIIDPVTGRPLKTEFSVSVIAPNATMSDGLSTTLLLLGPEKGKSLMNGMQGVSAIWISPKAQMETLSNGPQILFGREL